MNNLYSPIKKKLVCNCVKQPYSFAIILYVGSREIDNTILTTKISNLLQSLFHQSNVRYKFNSIRTNGQSYTCVSRWIDARMKEYDFRKKHDFLVCLFDNHIGCDSVLVERLYSRYQKYNLIVGIESSSGDFLIKT